MSQRFIRCTHCGLPHDILQVNCPLTGKPMARASRSSVPKMAAHAKIPVIPPAPLVPAIARKSAPAPHPATVPPPKPQKRDLLGRTLNDKYKVNSVLGEGGMGTVYEAEHLAIGRAVAIKILHPAQARKKDAVKRFHQEARAAGAIGHPNICEVYDFGSLEDGSPYLVMEKLVGETLADRIASEGGLPFDDVIDILTQVLSGLIAAHEKGVVHRDIKPENIFLTRRAGFPPVAKILDFGVSKMIHPVLSGDREDDLDLTRTGMVMGTPYYMSPEQARGERNLDARVDLWACGIILFEALTGRRPFQAANYNALLMQILTTDPKPARDLRPALPIGFDPVIVKAMARSREDRFPSAAAFQRDLQALRDRRQSAGPRPMAPEVPRVMLAAARVRDLASRAVSAADAAMRPSAAPPPAPAPALARREPPREPARVEPRRHAPPVPPAHRDPRDVSRAVPPGPPVMTDDTPSSLEIPVTFAVDTPLSGEQIPMMDLSKLEGSDRRAMQVLRNVAQNEYDDETEVTMPRFPRHHEGKTMAEAAGPAPRAAQPTAREPSHRDTATGRREMTDTDTTQRRGPEFAEALADARRQIIRDTLPQDPPQFAPPPRPTSRQASSPHAPLPPLALPPGSPPAWPNPMPPSKSVPPPPMPPPGSRLLRDDDHDGPDDHGQGAPAAEDDEDNDRTHIFTKLKANLPVAPAVYGADDTVEMDGDLGERLRDARDRLPSSLPPPTEVTPMAFPHKKPR